MILPATAAGQRRVLGDYPRLSHWSWPLPPSPLRAHVARASGPNRAPTCVLPRLLASAGGTTSRDPPSCRLGLRVAAACIALLPTEQFWPM